MPRIKAKVGNEGRNQIPFSQKQWESFAVYADGHKWFLMLPPQKYTIACGCLPPPASAWAATYKALAPPSECPVVSNT